MTTLNIHIQNKTFNNGTQAIQALQLKANAGEFIAIVGPSGTGKTSLLNIVAGIDQDFSGQVSLNTHTASTDTSPPSLGFMFQESRLMPWLTVQQNIELVMPSKNADSHTRLQHLLTQTDLSEFAEYFPTQLSGGMKKRVSMLRAFINRPQLLLMDEPFQSLDAPTANHLRQMLLTLWQDTQSIVLFVTHDLREALSMADRVIFLSARPSTVILDYPINLPRPRSLEDPAISQLQNQLLQQYPTLLSGYLSKSNAHDDSILTSL